MLFSPGYLAALTFLIFTGIGTAAQVRKLAKRTALWRAGRLEQREVCAGLLPGREFLSFSVSLFFAFSGLTRSYLDVFLLSSRLPVIGLATVLLWYLQFHRYRAARIYFLLACVGDFVLLVLLGVALAGYSLFDPTLVMIVDGSLSLLSLLFFLGKLAQAQFIVQEGRAGGVSLTRELGLVIKDIVGLWYALSVGAELKWVAITHALSATSSAIICLVKRSVERQQRLVVE